MRPHELNQGFTWQRRHGPNRTISDDQGRQYDDAGFFVFEDAFDAQELAGLTEQIDPVEERQEEWLRDHGGTFLIARADEITFTTHLVLGSEFLRRFVATPVLAGLCADLVGPDVRLYWDQAVYKKPHTESPFPWHQDNGYAFIEPQQYLTCWIALTDVDEENGCPWVVSGVHTMGTLAHEYSDVGLVCFDQPVEARPVPVRQGSIVVFSSLTPHCTGANRTDRTRKAYIVQYAPDGAEVLHVDGDGRVVRTPATDPGRQFPVLAEGRPVTD